jgi:hypothetical protein
MPNRLNGGATQRMFMEAPLQSFNFRQARKNPRIAHFIFKLLPKSHLL